MMSKRERERRRERERESGYMVGGSEREREEKGNKETEKFQFHLLPLVPVTPPLSSITINDIISDQADGDIEAVLYFPVSLILSIHYTVTATSSFDCLGNLHYTSSWYTCFSLSLFFLFLFLYSLPPLPSLISDDNRLFH